MARQNQSPYPIMARKSQSPYQRMARQNQALTKGWQGRIRGINYMCQLKS